MRLFFLHPCTPAHALLSQMVYVCQLVLAPTFFACTHSCVCTQANRCLQATTDYYYYICCALSLSRDTKPSLCRVFPHVSMFHSGEYMHQRHVTQAWQPCVTWCSRRLNVTVRVSKVAVLHAYVVLCVCVWCVHGGNRSTPIYPNCKPHAVCEDRIIMTGPILCVCVYICVCMNYASSN